MLSALPLVADDPVEGHMVHEHSNTRSEDACALSHYTEHLDKKDNNSILSSM